MATTLSCSAEPTRSCTTCGRSSALSACPMHASSRKNSNCADRGEAAHEWTGHGVRIPDGFDLRRMVGPPWRTRSGAIRMSAAERSAAPTPSTSAREADHLPQESRIGARLQHPPKGDLVVAHRGQSEVRGCWSHAIRTKVKPSCPDAPALRLARRIRRLGPSGRGSKLHAPRLSNLTVPRITAVAARGALRGPARGFATRPGL